MSTDLVLSRGCRHNDWWSMPQTSVEFCRSCGFSLIYAASRPSKDVYAEVQVQPRPQDTFDPARITPPGARSYQYQPLDLTNGRQIRVLVLKAGKLEDPLQCELEHVNLQQGPIYEALSYTWADDKGDDSISRAIQCGSESQSIGITNNCELALLRLRKHDVDRRLWVDAVCIDQSNILERNHQVKNMIAIFRSAIRVVVFLGEGNPILDRLVDYMSNDTGGQLPQVTDFISLFRSRWFHRVWVLQEVAVAKSILVMYGMKQMSWVDLIKHGNLFLRLMAARNLSLVLPPVISYGLRQTEAGDRRLEGRSDLLSLLQVSRNCACKDARDKVYSILGLLQEESVLSLQADYSPSTTPGWIFLQAAAWHVDTTKTLEILSQVDGTSALYMPSWVPDWTRKSPTALPAQFKKLREFSAPRIAVPDGQTIRSTARLGYPLESILEVTGWRYGTVWTDRKIFGQALVPSGGTNGSIYNQTSDLYAQSSSTMGNIHWLLNPSQNPGTQHCDERVDFWSRILSLYHGATPSGDFNPSDTTFPADIPPAFGGFCLNCFQMDQMHWQRIKAATKLNIAQTAEQATNQVMKNWTTSSWITEQEISPIIKSTVEQVIQRATKEAIERQIKQVTILHERMGIIWSINEPIEQATEQAMNIVRQAAPRWAIEQASNQHIHAIHEAVNRTIKLANKKVTCRCMSQSPSPGHFDKDELEQFITSMSQYGMSRRIFGTDHSLGLGPMELEDWDEVWTLEGATVPFILRPVGDHYKLVGACYIHGASKTTYRCSVCSYETVRDQITLHETTQPATGAIISEGFPIGPDGVFQSAVLDPLSGAFEERRELPFASTLSGSLAKIKIQ
ncbi:uncharacterized protein NECHADRAFT_77119 [Fusarium vanettenii 77-13-4]|uniref:Heterokaryon incompatibility domain-containing protein n=1 Tax=Fusarium vanettenii (strain ATCC MYA-4622 / CBS 123669 / FGSC 9596 / NRRL 45880 / 77-13-4) TaxID=660122 RepID=C7ZCP1_FUSV7|nr:uncharacterized protein NECHADRAFT_77119 [Fusarium vanettenii 77-13-4]EEU38295.1 hypothetical protein NECHADRAFT_77119 [Fusarium vanettenii 77-13-4]